jgi:hypothetical protein
LRAQSQQTPRNSRAQTPTPKPKPKTVTPAVVVRQRKPWRRKEGTYIYFEDNAGVIVNPKGEMKGASLVSLRVALLGFWFGVSGSSRAAAAASSVARAADTASQK